MPKRTQVIQYFPFFFGFLPFICTWIVSLPFYAPLADWIFLGTLAITLILGIYVHEQKEKDQLLNRVFFAIVLFMLLLLVQNTGWFFSPLIFVLYLATIAVILLYSVWSGAFFLLAICVLFFSYIDRNTPWYDYIRIASFFTALPLSVVFSAEFLRLKESEKEILILRKQADTYQGELERLRKNKLVWNDVLLRQSLATARNFALYWDSNSNGLPPKLARDLKRMVKKLDEALADIKKFEEKTVDDTYL